MNLNEAFRYQKFLNNIFTQAASSIQHPEHCLTTTKIHCRNDMNPDAADFEETVEVDAFYENDAVIEFIIYLIEEKKRLTVAINNAKQASGMDIDAMISANRMRQMANRAINTMLRYKGSVTTERNGRDYKFNAEGNQVPYVYDIETTTKEAFDREKSREIAMDFITTADNDSSAIDEVMINTVVQYEPPFNVNFSFDDCMDAFLGKKA